MGAIEFEDTVWGDQTMNRAYDEIVAEARAYHGSDPYSGSIANSCGVYKHYDVSDPIPLDEAHKVAQADYDNEVIQKGAAATAIPVLKVIPEKWDRVATASVRVELDPAKLNDQDYIKEVVLKEINKGSTNFPVSMPEGKAAPKRWKVENIESTREIPSGRHTTSKTKTVTTKGKTETRYFIIRTDKPSMLPIWADGYPSAAEARKHLPQDVGQELFYDQSGSVEENYEVISMTRRVGGEGMIQHQVVASKVSAAVEVKLRVLASARKVTSETGWYFYGLAAW